MTILENRTSNSISMGTLRISDYVRNTTEIFMSDYHFSVLFSIRMATAKSTTVTTVSLICCNEIIIDKDITSPFHNSNMKLLGPCVCVVG
jgi:hypothetical protein